MAESHIRVAPDSTGKKIHTRSRQVGADQVEEQYVIPIGERVRSGVYLAHTGAHTVLATADVSPAGRWFLVNPVGSQVTVALRRVEFMSQIGSALATPTSPRLLLRLFTFTGTPGGATVTPAKTPSTVPAATASLRTANTGMSITPGADVYAFLPVAAATAVATVAVSQADWLPEDEAMPQLAAGEGVMLTQADNGTASDTRRYITNIAWEEFTLP